MNHNTNVGTIYADRRMANGSFRNDVPNAVLLNRALTEKATSENGRRKQAKKRVGRKYQRLATFGLLSPGNARRPHNTEAAMKTQRIRAPMSAKVDANAEPSGGCRDAHECTERATQPSASANNQTALLTKLRARRF